MEQNLDTSNLDLTNTSSKTQLKVYLDITNNVNELECDKKCMPDRPVWL